jgi:hypothetical protein
VSERSRDACPACGEHELAVIDFPDQHSTGYLPANEILGMGEPVAMTPPAIGCLACGAEWPDLDAFRGAAAAGQLPPPPGESHPG